MDNTVTVFLVCATVLVALSLIGMAVAASLAIYYAGIERKRAMDRVHDVLLLVESRSEREHIELRRVYEKHLDGLLTSALAIPVGNGPMATGSAYREQNLRRDSATNPRPEPFAVNIDDNRIGGLEVG